ncbi:CAF17-like 4Fe-4S cluster assembly/insertion protein YgfZ [Arhodomonas sp. SL1]|uniref:CAF17-like 4Fe-4S cluster assembly/insertion protein YgfZ n=1 Tax=Arhodomonas sp. SL1 TaxID=3425691 RepID=UPI003F881C6A
MPDLGVLRVTGEDAGEFLHAQLTNAVQDMAPGNTRLAGWCNPKGRLLALFRVLRLDDGYRLLLPRPLVDTVIKRLRLFVLRSRVDIEDVSEGLTGMGLAGAATGGALAENAGTPPASADEAVQAGEVTVIRLPDPRPRWLLLAPAEETPALWANMVRALHPVHPEAWRLLDIQAGLPEVLPETVERFVPQMLNLEPLGGLCYEKGCYPGQEVVARMHYLGQLKRRLYRLRGEGDSPAPGAGVAGANGNAAGEIVMAAACGGAAFEALAVLRIEAADGPLEVDGRRLSPLPLPYQPPGEAA